MTNHPLRHLLLLALLATVASAAWADGDWPSGLNQRSFKKYWTVESESPDYRVSFLGDTCDLLAPKGLTLWRRQPVQAGMAVEYDAMVVDEGREGDRLSDMNCFWMASDTLGQSVFRRMDERRGIFGRCYALQMYYVGYGGNHNTTTRFRRYEGGGKVPPVWQEYTDADHLLKPNHWYHWRVETTQQGRTRFYVDGQLLVDYLDPEPLRNGWFGFRTTLSHTRIANFRMMPVKPESAGIPLYWLGPQPSAPQPVTFGVPFAPGELKASDVYNTATTDSWVMATWPDGSAKWIGVSTTTSTPLTAPVLMKQDKKMRQQHGMDVSDTGSQLVISTQRTKAFLPKQGGNIIDSLFIDGLKVGGSARLVASTTVDNFTSQIDRLTLERAGNVSAVVRADGYHVGSDGRRWLPFTLRLYFWRDSEQVKMVHSFVYDGEQTRDFITALGVEFRVPMRAETYNRHVAFALDGDSLWHEPVQPLDGRSPLITFKPQTRGQQPRPSADSSRRRSFPEIINWQALQMDYQRIPPRDSFDVRGQALLTDWAAWDGYRLSQLTDNAFTLRKRAISGSLHMSVSDGLPTGTSSEQTAGHGQSAINGTPWIGTFTGNRSPGFAFVGDTDGGLGVALKDFWQSYPSTMQIDGARSDEARLTMYLWSPEAEPMNLCHYDTVAHGLMASYEDVQEGLSTPYGIARTSTLWLLPYSGARPDYDAHSGDYRLLPTPEYLHQKRAFGLWALPSHHEEVERRLGEYLDIYKSEVERRKWYGFWNYGDVMHAFDVERQEWRYDVGGYAWDNTELGTPMWLWYSFLRTADKDVWRMAEAMTRHNSEVDTYHIGPLAPLGSRHNVSHWGCGAKEARISQSAFLRFYYYLTADERTGDLMHAQTDCDTLLYHLDPMRLAEPREKFPCSAPARLRFGPDWLAYAGNWLTEWERTGNTHYRDKIWAGLESAAQMPHGLFTGNKAWGYDPATGRMSYDGPADLRHTNHLTTIMGGFEVINELLPLFPSYDHSPFPAVWLDFARSYRENALSISRNRFPVRRLDAYAAWHDRDPERKGVVWQSLLRPATELSTNDAAMWSLDAIYMLEVIP